MLDVSIEASSVGSSPENRQERMMNDPGVAPFQASIQVFNCAGSWFRMQNATPVEVFAIVRSSPKLSEN